MVRILADVCCLTGLDPEQVFSVACEYLSGEGSEEARHTGEWAYHKWCEDIGEMKVVKKLRHDDDFVASDIKLPDWVEAFCIDILTGRIPIVAKKSKKQIEVK